MDMNNAATMNLDAMAARLAQTTGAPVEVARQGLREALAMLAVGMGVNPSVVDGYTERHGFWLRRR
jgi:hypothetical protein